MSALSILNPGKVAAETGATKAYEHVKYTGVLKNSQLVLVCCTAGSLCAQETIEQESTRKRMLSSNSCSYNSYENVMIAENNRIKDNNCF